MESIELLDAAMRAGYPLKTNAAYQQLKAALSADRASAMAQEARLFELRDLINRRPALNADTLAAYMKWTGEVYALDWLNAFDDRSAG